MISSWFITSLNCNSVYSFIAILIQCMLYGQFKFTLVYCKAANYSTLTFTQPWLHYTNIWTVVCIIIRTSHPNHGLSIRQHHDQFFNDQNLIVTRNVGWVCSLVTSEQCWVTFWELDLIVCIRSLFRWLKLRLSSIKSFWEKPSLPRVYDLAGVAPHRSWQKDSPLIHSEEIL